jgi:hypothetical protein
MSVAAARALGRQTGTLIDYRDLLREAESFERTAFENDTEVNGGDMVEWFAEWRARVLSALKKHGDGPRTTQRCLGIEVEKPPIPGEWVELPEATTRPAPDAVAHAPAWMIAGLGMEKLVEAGVVVNEGGPAEFEHVPGSKEIRAKKPRARRVTPAA